ncbi:ricin-type beta-trefoil lectin domain protein [Actinoallomurus iriomotensis]|uniref:Laminin G domain-containing protein n=1 Tax=Actinoallomurus iriomotensis TaxID=478107 RepID=A0A9W6VZN8_9ACTN|nr:ricin-type beta-trefoil lectin domain protein [Actinoallomurus iriomotensis]GLY86075.1 hypothetical protein Airi02_040040 [Actinoallomurus iriomotensis]
MILAASSASVFAFAGGAVASPASQPPHHAAKPAPLTRTAKVEQETVSALRQAKASGKKVLVPSLTTATSTTAADPQGTFTLSQSLEPVRVWRGGRWAALDARLHANPDRTLSPNATTTDVSLSGGGTGPLATMTATGHKLSVSWPTPLPAPRISGATATYPSVLDGVDLVVTVSPQGGFSDTLVVKNKAAAANPALSRLTMATTSNDLSVTADAAGNLKATATANGEPVFTATAPTMWDSSSPVASKTDLQPVPPSTVTAPGPHAHLARVKAAAGPAPTGSARGVRGTRRGSIALVPDHKLLKSASTVFPVFIDPTWVTNSAGSSRQAWAQTDTINKSAAHYKPSELQNGYCGWDTCIPTFTAESYVRMSVPSQLQGAQIYSSELDLTVAYGPYSSCSSAPNPGLELWWTSGISSSTTWNNHPTWHSKINTQSPPACSGQNVGFPITSFMQAHAQGASSLTFGLQGSSESDKDGWKQFHASTLTMSTTYDRAPKLPSIPATSPGGPCQTGSPSATVIGNDDVTFETVATDPDKDPLGVEFVIKDYGGTTVYDSGDAKTAPATSGGVTRLVLHQNVIKGWHTDGATTPHTYSWYTRTSDGKLYSPTTGTGSAGTPCNFTYDPTQPGSPGLTVTADTDDHAGALGQNGTFTVAPCKEALADPPTACTGTPPNRYIYQLNSSPPQSVAATGNVQTVQFPLTHVGFNTLTVYAISTAGNTSGQPASDDFIVTGPATPYPDGDIDGDSAHLPDLLAAGTGANPGLWLASGDGAGNLGTPTDIGAAGTGINTAGSPAEWTGAQILHGDFTGNHVQDVIAYYPTGNNAGGGSLLYGRGDPLPLDPYSDEKNLATDLFADYTLNADGDIPTQLVAAGNASLTGTGIADMIGITGDTTNGYQLDLYTTCIGCDTGSYNYAQTLAGPTDSPDGAGDWNNFSLTTAQPGGQTVLFALKKTTGELWEATNPSQNPATPIGTPTSAGGTWTKLTVPWTSTTVPTPVSGDVNAAGAIELWAQSSTNATPYTLSGTTLSKGTTVSLLVPTHQWPLTSSSATTSSCTATTCTPDTRGGTDASVTGGVTFIPDPAKGALADLDGTGYLTPPDNLIAASTTLTITLSFRADPGSTGILLSTGNDTPDKLNVSTMPVMYIGTDGRLYAQFWNGYVRPMISAHPVNDGQWHTATLGADGNNQSLFVDDELRVGMAGSPDIRNLDPKNYIGAGVFPLSSTKFWVNAPGDTTKTRASYFHGEISDVSYYSQYLTPAQVTPFHQPTAVTGPITSELSSNLCVEDAGNATTNGTKIQTATCNGNAGQQWTITPDATNGLNNTIIDHKCMTVSGGGTANNTPIILSDCTGATSQEWHLDSLGQIWNPHSSKCLADPGSSTTPGTQLVIYDCDYGKDQNWHVP